MVKDLPQNDPPLGRGGSNSSSLCRNVEETSDYDLKPVMVKDLPQKDPPFGRGGSNSSSLCRNVEETSDYDLKPVMVKDLPQKDPPLGRGGSNSSSLCRNVEETSDYDLKPLHLSYLVIRSNLEEHLYDVWNQTFYFVTSRWRHTCITMIFDTVRHCNKSRA